MFTDIYVSMQASQVLQQGWRVEAAEQTRPGRLGTFLRRALVRK